MGIGREYRDLVFTRAQLVLDDEEYLAIASEFFPGRQLAAGQLTDRDRAFLQAILVMAVDASRDSSMLFTLYSIVMRGGPSTTITDIAKKFSKKVAQRWVKSKLGESPKINAVGRAAIRASAYRVDWRLRLEVQDPGQLTNFLA